MITQTSLRRMCSTVVFNRAQMVAHGGKRFHDRRCRFDGSDILLRAKVDASASWDGPYRTNVILDEENDYLVDYECNCPAAWRFMGPCKHVVALALDFIERPELYAGYEEWGKRNTSRTIARIMERATPETTASAGASTESGSHTVSLEPTLSFSSDTFFELRFRVVGEHGAYVMKSISEFVTSVEGSEFHSYGKKLAFVHDQRAFSAQGWELAQFLMRAVRNRRFYALERVLRFGGGSTSETKRELRLSPPELWEFLESQEGRSVLFDDRSARGGSAHRLRVRKADPELEVGFATDDEGGYELVLRKDVKVFSSGGRAMAWDRTTFYLCSERFSRHAELLRIMTADPSERLHIADADLKRFCATALPQLEESVTVAIPAELEQMRPAPCELQFKLDRHGDVLTCLAEAHYGEVHLFLEGQALESGADDAVMRDLVMEARGKEAVRRYFPVSDGGHAMVSNARRDDLARLVFEGVAELQQLGTVFVTPAFDRLRSHARPVVSVGVAVRSNLLDLSLDVDGVSPNELAGILESYRLKRTYHRLSDGSFMRMEDADVAEAARVVDELGVSKRRVNEGSATMPAYRALMVDGLLDDEDKDVSFEDYLQRIRSVDLGAYEAPASLAGVLRPYQVVGYQWLCGLVDLGLGGILADEMGLGKTVQLIAFLLAHQQDLRSHGPALVVCPASLVYNWQAEFAKFAPGLVCRLVVGSVDERQQARAAKDVDVLVTSYDLLRRDVVDYGTMPIWCLALDEAQYIKNHQTIVAQAVKSVDALHGVALTGTPIENRLSELWSIFDFLMPGLLGSYVHFRDRYERPIVEDEDDECATRLRTAIRPFVLRRTKREVFKDLPEKVEEVVRAHLGPRQRALYDAQAQELAMQLANGDEESFKKGKLQVLAGLMRLRQICCDPSLLFDDYDEGSAKTDTILTLVERVVYAGEKMLVFSQFTSFLSLIGAQLKERGITYYTLTGATPKRRRADLVKRFNADDTPVFLISLKAGGTGLNLTGASVVIHADPWWNAAAQNQATDRAHRIGQTRDVTVYKVIAANTIEERILDLQATKTQLAEAVVEGDATGVSLASLTAQDLADLLG